jgi:hypothetical protein
MAWNITHDPEYAKALEANWEKRMASLRVRTEQLDVLSSMKGEADVVSEFSRAVPFWAKHRKSIERLEGFLFNLKASGKAEAYAGCMKAWAEEVHRMPASFHGFFKIQNMPRNRSAHATPKKSNPYFSAKDSFEALNGYLAIDPMGCLQQRGLLSKNWLKGLSTDSHRDAAVVAIFSAFYRFGDQMDFCRAPESYEQGRVEYVNRLCSQIGESTGVDFVELLRRMEDVKKASPVVSRFYRELVDYRSGTSGASIPSTINNLYTVMRTGGLFELAMKARIFSTPAHVDSWKKGYSKESDSSYYHWFIDSEFVAISELKVAFEVDKLAVEHIHAMHAKGLAVPYLKSLSEEDLATVMERGIIEPKHLGRSRDRGRLLANDLGI